MLNLFGWELYTCKTSFHEIYIRNSKNPLWKWVSDGSVPLTTSWPEYKEYFDGLMQDCSISSVLAMEILQSSTEQLIDLCRYWPQ